MTALIQPFSVKIDLVRFLLDRPDRHNVRRASAMRGYYADAAAMEKLIAAGDPLHYETFEKAIPEEPGHLLFCISRIQPGLVGQECFMTKGHYHQIAQTGEVYYCLQGCGLMVMKTVQGQAAWESMEPGSVVYVPPYWAHRSVNTGHMSL